MGTESCFLLMAASDPSQKMTSSNLHIYTYANLHKRNGHFLLAAGRGWYGCQRPLSPLKEVSLVLQSSLTTRELSHGRWTLALLALHVGDASCLLKVYKEAPVRLV